MPIKNINKCVFNKEVQNKIYNLYRESNLEVLEYLVSISKTWGNEAQEYLNRYLAEPTDIDEQDTDIVKIFWEAMDHYGMTEIIKQKEYELSN